VHFSLCDLVADIAQNAAESGADTVKVDILETDTEFRFDIQDNGSGMTESDQKRALDPFCTDGKKHPHRKVGLGLPFLVQTAEQSGGGWELKSEKGKGTRVSAWFDSTNVDTPPLGNIPRLVRTVLLFNGPDNIFIQRSCKRDDKNCFWTASKKELVDVLGNLEDAGALVLLDQYLQSQEADDETAKVE